MNICNPLYDYIMYLSDLYELINKLNKIILIDEVFACFHHKITWKKYVFAIFPNFRTLIYIYIYIILI